MGLPVSLVSAIETLGSILVNIVSVISLAHYASDMHDVEQAYAP